MNFEEISRDFSTLSSFSSLKSAVARSNSSAGSVENRNSDNSNILTKMINLF